MKWSFNKLYVVDVVVEGMTKLNITFFKSKRNAILISRTRGTERKRCKSEIVFVYERQRKGEKEI